MAEKALNYTAEQTAAIVTAYKELPTKATVEELAVKFGKSVRSIVAKLSREGVYQKAERVSKTGEAIVKKDGLSDELAMLVGLTEAEADSLTKANKTALVKILAVIKEAKLSKEIVS